VLPRVCQDSAYLCPSDRRSLGLGNFILNQDLIYSQVVV
jgi:hypothetical protein